MGGPLSDCMWMLLLSEVTTSGVGNEFTSAVYILISYRPTDDNGVKIVAVDLQLMASINGVIQIHGDITKVTLE